MKARALYDNASETPDELSFLRNEVLEVLERDYDGMEGWWLCELKGKTGIAPANRLVIITMVESPTMDYDTPKSKSFSPSGSRPNSKNNSLTEDYDSPVKSNISPTSSSKSKPSHHVYITDKISNDDNSFKDYDTPNQSQTSFKDNERNKSKHSSRSSGDLNFCKIYENYKSQEKSLTVVITQLHQLLVKWKECTNFAQVLTVAKVICVSFWNKLQTYIAESSKLMATIKNTSTTHIVSSLNKIKSSNRELENVLDNINKNVFLSSEPNGPQLFFKSMESIIENIKTNADVLSTFFETANKDKLYDDPETILPLSSALSLDDLKQDNTASNSFGDYDTPNKLSFNTSITSQNALYNKSNNSSFQNKSRTEMAKSYDCSEFVDYDRPKSTEFVDYDRPRSTEFLDYDTPNKSKNKTKINTFIADSDKNTDYDMPISKSSLPIRHQQMAPSTPSDKRTGLLVSNVKNYVKNEKNITSPTASETNSNTRVVSFEALDYDYPSHRPEKKPLDNSTVPNYTAPLNSAYKNLLKHNRPFIEVEIKHMQVLIISFEDHCKFLSEEEDGKFQSIKLVNYTKLLAASAHKILFTFDFIHKKISGHADFINQLNVFSMKICESLKNLTSLVKQVVKNHQNNSVYTSDKQQHLMSSLNDVKECAALIFYMISFWV